MSKLLLPTQTLKSWAERMARKYAKEIPDYARLDANRLMRDVAVVSEEFLRALARDPAEGPLPGAYLTEVALETGRRRRRQTVSLHALLRAYRLWGRYTLELLTHEAPRVLADLASDVAVEVDIVSEASAHAFELSAEPPSRGPMVGIAGAAAYSQAVVLAARYLPREGLFDCEMERDSFFLFVSGSISEVAPGAGALAQDLGCVLLLQAGHGEQRRDVKEELREAAAVAAMLDLPAGTYETRFLWALSLGMASPRHRDRFMQVLAPLEAHPPLLQTLETHFSAGLSPKNTAEALGIHVNTVYYRLAKIEELIKCDLERMNVLTTLYLALALRKATS